MLEPQHLTTALVVAQLGSFSAAAQALHYTPSAISQQIAALEKQLGVLIFERGARGVSPTEAGCVLLREAEAIEQKYQALKSEVQALAGLRAGLLRVGWFATAGSTVMPRAIAQFEQMYPGVTLALFEGDPDACVPKLRARELELALIYQFEDEEDPAEDLTQFDLFDDPLCIGLPQRHPLAGRPEVTLEELAGERWIQGVSSGATAEVLPRACRHAGFEPDVSFRTNDRTAVEGLVAAGLGVALIPTMSIRAVRPDIEVLPLIGRGLVRQVRAAIPPTAYRSPAATAMVEVLRDTSQLFSGDSARPQMS